MEFSESSGMRWSSTGQPLQRGRGLLVQHHPGEEVLAAQLGSGDRLQAASGCRTASWRIASQTGVAQGVRKPVVVARVAHLGGQQRVQLELPLPVLLGQGPGACSRLRRPLAGRCRRGRGRRWRRVGAREEEDRGEGGGDVAKAHAATRATGAPPVNEDSVATLPGPVSVPLTRRLCLPQNAEQSGGSLPDIAPLALSDYDFDLPDGLIARAPLERRDASRLLVLDRDSGAVAHRRFRDWPGLLRDGRPGGAQRHTGHPRAAPRTEAGSGGRVELLLVRPDADVDAAAGAAVAPPMR